MPIPTPNKGEKQSKFVSRCVSALSDKGEYTQEQRVAICTTTYQKAKASNTAEDLAIALMGRCKDCKMSMDECECEDEDEEEDEDEDDSTD